LLFVDGVACDKLPRAPSNPLPDCAEVDS